MTAIVVLGVLVDVVLTRLMVGTGRAREAMGPSLVLIRRGWGWFYAMQALRAAVCGLGVALIPWVAWPLFVVVWAPTVVGLGQLARRAWA